MNFRHAQEGNLVFVLICQVDNYIYAGEPHEMFAFERFLQEEFDVGELRHNDFTVYGCEFVQHENKSVTLAQSKRLRDLEGQPRVWKRVCYDGGSHCIQKPF